MVGEGDFVVVISVVEWALEVFSGHRFDAGDGGCCVCEGYCSIVVDACPGFYDFFGWGGVGFGTSSEGYDYEC